MNILFWIVGVIAVIVAIYVLTRIASIAYFRTRYEYDHRRAIMKYLVRNPKPPGEGKDAERTI